MRAVPSFHVSTMLTEDSPICFTAKSKVPQVQTQYVSAAPIAALPTATGIQYGGQNDVASGNADATVDKDADTSTEVATSNVPSTAPAFEQNTSVSTTETKPTKLSKLKRTSAV